MVAGLIGFMLACLTPGQGQTGESCEPVVHEGGWQLPALKLLAQPEKAVSSETVESGGLMVEVKVFRRDYEEVTLPGLKGCASESAPKRFLLFAMTVFYYSNRPYSVQLNMDPQFEDGSIGCLARAWLSDQDGDGVFETLTLSPGATGIPVVPKAFLREVAGK